MIFCYNALTIIITNTYNTVLKYFMYVYPAAWESDTVMWTTATWEVNVKSDFTSFILHGVKGAPGGISG